MDENKIVKKLLEHDDQFDQVIDEIHSSKMEILSGLDKILTKIQTLDHERIANYAALERLESRINIHDKDIVKLKRSLKVS